MMWKGVKYAVLGLVLYRIIMLVILMGFHRSVHKHHPGPCRRIKTLTEGSEDMERIPGDKVLVTTGLRLTNRRHPIYAKRSGKVYMLDMKYPEQDPQLVTIREYPDDLLDADFHGLSVWVDKQTGVVSVFIVNHGVNFDKVEIFTYNDAENTLYHKKSCTDDTFRLLNDVVAVSDSQFYATNFFHTRDIKTMYVELVVPLRWASVVFYDGQGASRVVEGLLIANGINKSPDGRYVYVATVVDEVIYVYERQPDNGLQLKQVWSLHLGGDNIIVDPDSGDLWVAGQPIFWDAIQYGDNPLTSRSASQVLHLKTNDGMISDMSEPFLDDGELISSASVALHHGNKLLIGSVCGNAAICDINYIM